MQNRPEGAADRLNDDDIRRIAEEIVAEWKRKQGARQVDYILSQSRELPLEDEERVAEVAAQLLARQSRSAS